MFQIRHATHFVHTSNLNFACPNKSSMVVKISCQNHCQCHCKWSFELISSKELVYCQYIELQLTFMSKVYLQKQEMIFDKENCALTWLKIKMIRAQRGLIKNQNQTKFLGSAVYRYSLFVFRSTPHRILHIWY